MTLRIADGSRDAKGDQKDCVGGGTPEVDGTSTEVAGENPRKHDEDHLKSGGNKTQCERGIRANVSLCHSRSVINRI